MVLEMLANPGNAERKPWELFFIGIVYSSVALLSGLLVFRAHAGVAMVFFTTLGCMYFVQKLLRMEEAKDQSIRGELQILKEHGKALSVFVFLFLGFVVAFSVWYVFLPGEASHQVFGVQEKAIQCINNPGVQGCATGTAEDFFRIFFNNVRVLLLTLGFAFFYGAGAIFILAWNAAVVGTAVGIFVRNGLGTLAGGLGIGSVASYFGLFSVGLLRYMTHGIFEITAYFMAALAGGIISIAIARHDFRSPEFRKVLFDSVDVIALAVGVLFFATVIEVFVTPLFF